MRELIIAYDLFFLSEKFLRDHQNFLKNELVLPRKEFNSHSSYHTVTNVTNHRSWAMDYDVVLVAPPGWYETQNLWIQQALYHEMNLKESAMIHSGHLITSNYWQGLSLKEKQAWFQAQDEPLGGTDLSSLSIPDHLRPYHNVFPEAHGPNCFAASLYAITKNPFILQQWVHPLTFLETLTRSGYQLKEDSLFCPADVLAFYKNHQLIHTTYLVNDQVAFNKNGQSFHEAWQVKPLDQVLATFDPDSLKIHRSSLAGGNGNGV